MLELVPYNTNLEVEVVHALSVELRGCDVHADHHLSKNAANAETTVPWIRLMILGQ